MSLHDIAETETKTETGIPTLKKAVSAPEYGCITVTESSIYQ
ncbi:MAG: hypothetical protein J07HQW1_03325 [Haloquadratum walsbyi J07HQW1]|jgi:hypothetical protein|uniref:Uncharacterized protein n=1 Tax=Haloquadratum walsbyi J07HQW1 TaxID=1238424 RepID=U1MSS7_9EURY|nr:MAG: hypothetical protein J07HQW1_03325 [Haloquadratum walsbyi J07HQW1]